MADKKYHQYHFGMHAFFMLIVGFVLILTHFHPILTCLGVVFILTGLFMPLYDEVLYKGTLRLRGKKQKKNNGR